LTIKKPSIKLYSQHISQGKPVIDASQARPKAAIIREKEVTEREMANAMYLAGLMSKTFHDRFDFRSWRH
jgi:phosphoribosylformylglycinamidine synthase